MYLFQFANDNYFAWYARQHYMTDPAGGQYFYLPLALQTKARFRLEQ